MEFFFFFFSSRRRHTRFDCDWSSDVCSSDLRRSFLGDAQQVSQQPSPRQLSRPSLTATAAITSAAAGSAQIGRASCRGRVEISVGAGSLKKKKKEKEDKYIKLIRKATTATMD